MRATAARESGLGFAEARRADHSRVRPGEDRARRPLWSVGDPRSKNWRDPAGHHPISGAEWRVCGKVSELERPLGPAPSQAGARRWQNMWRRLTKEQRVQYIKTRGDRPPRPNSNHTRR